jgi:hypothetical protein
MRSQRWLGYILLAGVTVLAFQNCDETSSKLIQGTSSNLSSVVSAPKNNSSSSGSEVPQSDVIKDVMIQFKPDHQVGAIVGKLELKLVGQSGSVDDRLVEILKYIRADQQPMGEIQVPADVVAAIQSGSLLVDRVLSFDDLNLKILFKQQNRVRLSLAELYCPEKENEDLQKLIERAANNGLKVVMGFRYHSPLVRIQTCGSPSGWFNVIEIQSIPEWDKVGMSLGLRPFRFE